jgi:septal ring factor EnvC (AmiA/AmiB activator)
MFSLSSAVQADTKQEKIKAQISKANVGLKRARQKTNSIAAELKKNESEINRLSRKQYQTEQKISSITQQMIKSNQTKQGLAQEIKLEKEALAKQLLAMYSSGEESHLRLLLKQDDPSDISRTTKYFEYLNRSRVKRIQGVRKRLAKAEDIERSIIEDKERLQKLRTSLTSDKVSLKKELANNSQALKKSKSVVVSQQSKLNKLKKQEAALQAVFDNLIRKQKAKAKAAAKRAAAKAKAQKKKATKKITKTAKASKPKKMGKKTSLNFVANRPFSSLRGRLSWPVKGRIYKKYGSRRNQKQKWKGVLIKAPGGQRVHAVAEGKVEYAGPLRGYGYVVILQHDKNYRTLYAYNRAVYRQTGDVVKAGAVIAAVGNSGGQEQNALYFEIRKGASTKNPARWCK